MSDVSFEQSPPRQRAPEGNPQRILVVVIAVLALVLVSELIYHFLISPWLRIDRIVIDSDLSIGDERLLEISGLSERVHFAAVNPASVEQRISELPEVRSADVSKRFPNELSISVTKRTPLAVAFAGEDSFPVVFDAEGVVFQWKREVESLDLPVISGLRFENPRLGTRLPRYLGAFLRDLEELQSEAPVLFRQISEYRIVPNGERDFDVVLYPQSFDVPVRMEPRIDERTARYMLMVLDAFRRDGSLDTIRELDFRAGEVVFRTREEQ